MADGFPTLKPAFTMLVEIAPPMAVGQSSRGPALNVVPMTHGTLTSHPTFPLPLSLEFAAPGADYIHMDPSGAHLRLNAHGVLKPKDADTGAGAASDLVYVHYQGTVDVTPALGLILGGSAEAKSTDFGGSFITLEFTTGNEAWKVLETGVFVAAGRFVVEEGRPTTVEYRVSQVVAG